MKSRAGTQATGRCGGSGLRPILLKIQSNREQQRLCEGSRADFDALRATCSRQIVSWKALGVDANKHRLMSRHAVSRATRRERRRAAVWGQRRSRGQRADRLRRSALRWAVQQIEWREIESRRQSVIAAQRGEQYYTGLLEDESLEAQEEGGAATAW